MSTEADIVERLRKHVSDRGGASIDNGAWQMMLEAADMLAILKDPAAVHLNMLRGGIAKLSWANIQHLYPEEFAKLRAERDAAARDMRERCAAWHDEQCYSGHCGETTADNIFRQRHNKMHEEAAYNIRLLEAPAIIATEGDNG